MQRVGFRVIPIHPEADSILGEQAYPSLSALPGSLAAEVDVVNVFRPPAELPGIVDQALEHLPNLKAIWAQKG
ncbi:MAG: CoA-binding protein, partial [Anaerolineae bacterium]|nr:CoA-binding protein [Anaerolineae bacterium]NIN99628.1 CoA-binding protein [Anaerolineae bacterium]